MRASRIFRVIWRINALLILGAGLILAAILCVGLYQIGQEVFRPRQISETVNVEPEAQRSTQWMLGNFERVAGTDYLAAPVFSAQTYRVPSVSSVSSVSSITKNTSAVRNYLFVNSVDKASRWLVPHNNYLFLSVEELGWPKPDSDAYKVKWIWYEVVKSDTNGDGRLTDEDRRTVAIADASGDRYIELVPDVDVILGAAMRGQDTLLIFYRSGSKNLVSEIALAGGRVTVTKDLPEIQPGTGLVSN